MLSTTEVFDAARDGYYQYRIPVLGVTAAGTVLCASEARNTPSDWGEIEILMRRSTDGGRTFEPAVSIAYWPEEIEREAWQLKHAHAAQKGRTHNNPVFIAERDGTVHFLFCIEYIRVFHRYSTDDGVTWSEPKDITAAFEPLRGIYPWRVVATGPNHGIQLENGRLLTPVWLSRGSDTGGGDHRPSVVASLYSDDGGKNWECGEIAAHEDAPLVNPSETTAAQLPDGRVVFNIRAENKEHRRAAAFSADGASGWTTPVFVEDLLEPVCHGSLLGVGEALYFSNPQPNLEGIDWRNKVSLPRENLTLFRSEDGGRTWPVRRSIDARDSGYSDLGVLPDGTLLCFYERRTDANDPGRWNSHVLVRFDGDWISGEG